MIEELRYATTDNTDVIDITRDVQSILNRAGAKEGSCVIFCPGSTATITTIECEPNTIRDLKEALDRLVPPDAYYHHEKTWHDGNGYSHVRAALMKPGITVPFAGGTLCLGTWQQVVLVDFDNKPRNRVVLVQVLEPNR